MKTAKDRIEEISRQGYPFSFDTIFNDTTRIYKNVALPAGLAFLFFGIVYFIATSLLSQGIDASHIKSNDGFSDIMREVKYQMENKPLQQKMTDSIVGFIVGVLMIPMVAGGVGLSRTFDTGKDGSMGGIFQYFKGHSFSDLFVSGLLLNLLTFGIGTLAEYTQKFSLGLAFVLFLVNIGIAVLSVLFVPLIIFGNLGPMEAIRGSFVVVSKNFWMILLLVVIVTVLCLLGLFACCIGVFFTLPLYCTFVYSLYKHSVGFDENPEIEDIY